MWGWSGRRFALAFGLLGLWLVSTYIEEWLNAPGWVVLAGGITFLVSWIVLGNLRRFR